MKELRIIVVVGMAGSGKGTVVERLEEKFGFPKVYFGGMVYEEVKRRGLDITKDEEFVREDMRKQDGVAVLAKRVTEKIRDLQKAGELTVVLDGLYSWSEYQYLRQEFADALTVVGVFTPRAERYRRAVSRDDKRRSYTLESIEKRDIAEIENIEKGGPIAIADYMLLNDKSIEQLHSDTDELMAKIII